MYTKDETEKIAFEWQSLLVSAAKGGEPSTYVIEPGIILWSVQVCTYAPPPYPPPLLTQHLHLRVGLRLHPHPRCSANNIGTRGQNFIAFVQDGSKGYDIIEFCFLRPEFHEVRDFLHRALDFFA